MMNTVLIPFSLTRCSIVALACFFLSTSTAHALTDVYLFGGQSNMEQGIVNGFTAKMQQLDPSATIVTSRYLDSGRGLDSGWNGSAWLGDPPGAGRITFYAGNSQFDPNIGTAYSAMLSSWKSTLASISGDYEIKGIFWVQGEQDTKHFTSASRYASSLDNLIDRLHSDLGLATGSVAFYYSSMESTAAHFPYADVLRAQQLAADKDSGDPLSIANAILVDASGLDYTDGVHYNATSQALLGERFAAAVPEPTTLSLVAVGVLFARGRRRSD